ncbi:isopentenyl-diphosphate Delta-isomerase [Pedobacter heparinus]|uniref:isopentenyl-diphosphate Delta-isomerase n=1 Tax=Pedobacter heparinus TaxID=984 RepID=UPI00292DE7A4|nr:isopentenyl-diphosphate Delta-isomerase [Pedobacter heparinus]
MIEEVILVDENDQEIGLMEKMEAHLRGRLHRAFSVFIFNTKGELLLQKRAEDKYHSAGKWTNTCCSHPRYGEQTVDAANRRLKEEMGMHCKLVYGFSFLYKATLADGISEHEYDHVFFGLSNSLPLPDPTEVASFKYVNMDLLLNDINANPEDYTAWLKICFQRVMQTYQEILDNV